MATDLTVIFRAFLAGTRAPDGTPYDYGIRAVSDSLDNDDITVTVIFKGGCTYCCGEPGCHFSPNWSRLRSIAADSGIVLGSPLTIRFHGIVEADSTFTSTVNSGGPERNDPYEYHVTYTEEEEDPSVHMAG